MGNTIKQPTNTNLEIGSAAALACIGNANTESSSIPTNLTRTAPPALHRQTHNACMNDFCRNCVSEYGHQLCWECCQPGDTEWNYHNG